MTDNSALEVLANDLKQWRISNKTSRGRIPNEYRDRARDLASQYGIEQIHKAIKLRPSKFVDRPSSRETKSRPLGSEAVTLGRVFSSNLIQSTIETGHGIKVSCSLSETQLADFVRSLCVSSTRQA